SPHPLTPHTYPLSLHDALPIFDPPTYPTHPTHLTHLTDHAPPAQPGDADEPRRGLPHGAVRGLVRGGAPHDRALLSFRRHHRARSEEHTSELQSRRDLVCRLLL